MKKELTVENVTEALEAAVEEMGADYIYPEHLKFNNGVRETCVYFHPELPTQPCCIVGNALNRLGYTLADIQDKALIGQDIDAFSLIKKLGGERKVANALDMAQFEQDNGGDWGKALNSFRESLNERS